EDALAQGYPTNELPDDHSQCRQRRDERVGQGMLDVRRPPRHALALRSAHVQRAGALCQGGPQEAHQRRRDRDTQRESRHQQQFGVHYRVLAEWHIAAGWEPSQPDGEHYYEHDSEPELRDRHSDGDDRAGEAVEQTIRLDRGGYGGRDSDQECYQDRSGCELRRGGQTLGDEARDRVLAPEGQTEVPLEDATNPFQVLDVNRLIQSEFAPQ